MLCAAAPTAVSAHDILFCGEVIPVNNDFVATKLMSVIRTQIPTANLPSLRQRALQYFPYVESMLRRANLPLDFKYLPIVESGFATLSSQVGAQGFWQLMPATARDYGLSVGGPNDDRNDINKSTDVACRLLVAYYNTIIKRMKVASWSLTAAAYNFGIGNVLKAVSQQGSNDYFTLNLNPETAVYVYKIIAIKELFEYPELYMKSSFGYNVFSASAAAANGNALSGNSNAAGFTSLSVKVSKKKNVPLEKQPREVFIPAHLKGKYKDFKDGDLVAVELDEDLTVQGGFFRSGSVIKGNGWIIDNRVLVDLGFGHNVLLFDNNGTKGIPMASLQKGEPVLLHNEIYEDQTKW